MRMLFAVALSSAVLLTAGRANAQEDYYVTAPVLNERSAPVSGEVVNKIYRGQKLTVYDVREGWALVTEPGFVERWVSMQYLSKTKPDAPPPFVVPAEWDDPRIARSAFPNPGEDNLSQKDVEILWRRAKKMLDDGRCDHVDYGHKSASKADTYYVNCGGPNNLFFTEADLNE